MQTDYLTTSETAKIFHVTRFTVLNWVKKHKLQSVATLGGHQRIPRQAILELLKKNTSIDQAQAVNAEPENWDLSAASAAPSEPSGSALREIASRGQASVNPGAFLAKQTNKIGSIIKEGAFFSGKYIAGFRHQIKKPDSGK